MGLGKGRNARKRKNKEKKRKEDKADDKEEATVDILEDVEKVKVKLSLLKKEEEEEKEKINFALTNERNTLLALAEQVETTGLEKVSLEEEMKEIESALNDLLQRKSKVAENQKAVETRFATIKKEETILKQNVAAQVHESEAKIALIQGDIKIAELSLEKVDSKKDRGGNRELENFLEAQILELEGELECPVCLEVAATSPIYKCPDEHLLCRFKSILSVDQCVIQIIFRDCRPKLTHCPQCREVLGDQYKRCETFKKRNSQCESITFPSLVRFRGGERQAEKLKRLFDERHRLRVHSTAQSCRLSTSELK